MVWWITRLKIYPHWKITSMESFQRKKSDKWSNLKWSHINKRLQKLDEKKPLCYISNLFQTPKQYKKLLSGSSWSWGNQKFTLWINKCSVDLFNDFFWSGIYVDANLQKLKPKSEIKKDKTIDGFMLCNSKNFVEDCPKTFSQIITVLIISFSKNKK